MIGRAAGAAEVDVGCTDASERNEQRKGECGDCQEYRLVGLTVIDELKRESAQNKAAPAIVIEFLITVSPTARI